MKTKQTRITRWSLITVILLSILIGIGLSYTVAVEVEKSEGGKFCAKCHTMAPMATAHARSTHGGNNTYGVVAQCTDCHLPHDTIANYLSQKVKFGINDIAVELFTDTSDINWSAKRANAQDFVFNSGCLSCHSSLDHSKMEQIDPSDVKKIMDKDLKMSCIECHANVGHKWDKATVDDHNNSKAIATHP